MRAVCLILLLPVMASAFAQDRPVAEPRPLVLHESVALPLSLQQVEQAVRRAWPLSFGMEPGARIVSDEAASGRVEGEARFNFKSSTTGSRLSTLGVIRYQISIQAENGLCRIRIAQFSHTGNEHAPQGPVSLGRVYNGGRPAERVPGISLNVAQRLNDDMATQLKNHLAEVIKVFTRELRKANDG